MKYRPRHAEQKLLDLVRHFKVVLVTGARQVGKSTLLEHLFPHYKSIVFDPVQDIYGARRDPDLFLDNFPPPLILDEVQYAPELLPALKRRVDRQDAVGQYLMTGSQNLSVLRTVSESLAGRVGILPLAGMTPVEMKGLGHRKGWLGTYLESPDTLPDLLEETEDEPDPLSRFLWRGCLPGLLDLPDRTVPDYFLSYIQTYVERDVRSMDNIRELASFDRFLGLSAALTAQEINTNQLGRDIDISPTTARKWLDLLTNTYQWLELFPYQGNAVKRLSGKRKGFLRDTGLACYLQRISSPEALAVNPLMGSLFETWAVNDVHRQFVDFGVPPQAYHWRSHGGGEVDLVLERDGRFHPVEIKCKTHLSGHDTRGLRAFRDTYPENRVMTGLVIYAGRLCYRLSPDIIALPWTATLSG